MGDSSAITLVLKNLAVDILAAEMVSGHNTDLALTGLGPHGLAMRFDKIRGLLILACNEPLSTIKSVITQLPSRKVRPRVQPLVPIIP